MAIKYTEEELVDLRRKSRENGDIKQGLMYHRRLENLRAKNSKPEYNKVAEGIRATAGGALFSFADEIEAGIRSGSFSNKQYRELRNKLRAKQARFAEENPEIAIPAMIAGSLIVPGGVAVAGAKTVGKGAVSKAAQALSKPTIARQAMVGAGYGALEAAGSSEEINRNLPGEIVAGAALGGGLGGGLATVGRALSPKISKEASKLMQEGVTLTPGQMAGGTLKNWEEVVVPMTFGEAAFAARRLENLQSFNLLAANKAFAPLGKRIPEDATPEDLITSGMQIVDDAYKDLYKDFTFKTNTNFKNAFGKFADKEIIENSLDDSQRRVVKSFQETALRMLDEVSSGVPGQNLHLVMSTLRKYSTNLTNVAEKQGIKNTYDKLIGNLEKQIAKQNPKYAAKEKKVRESYLAWTKIEKAMGAGRKEGEAVFTPNQLLQALKTTDKSARRRNYAAGKAPLQDLASSAGNVIGKPIGDSGTAGRLTKTATGGLAINAGVDPLIASLLFAPKAIYSKTAQNFLNRYARRGLMSPNQPFSGRLGDALVRSSAPLSAITTDSED